MNLKPWQFMTMALAGWMNRQQQEMIAYLKTENQILREKLGTKRILLNDNQKRRLSLEEMEFVSSLVQGQVVPLEEEARRIARSNSLAQILDLAIQAERGSQAFYRQIAAEVDSEAAGTVREIIAEEARHEQILTKVRSEITA